MIAKGKKRISITPTRLTDGELKMIDNVIEFYGGTHSRSQILRAGLNLVFSQLFLPNLLASIRENKSKLH